jgi:hypothetical protein
MTNAERIARDAKIGRTLLVLVVGAACALSLYAIWVNVQQGSDITNVHNDVTKIQKTPCGKSPTNPTHRCEELRQALAASESIVAECIAHQRVEGTKGRNCDHYYVDVRLGGSPDPNLHVLSDRSTPGRGADQPRSTGHHQSAPTPSPGGGHPDASDGTDHGDGKRSDPPPPAATPGSSTGSSAGSSPTNPTQEQPPSATGTMPSTVEAAGGAVKEAGEGVGGAVEGVGKGVDCALRGGCP